MSKYSQIDVSPRAILLAQEINRQCDQLLAIIAEMCDKLDAWDSQLKAENNATAPKAPPAPPIDTPPTPRLLH